MRTPCRTGSKLAALISNLRTVPLGADDRVRISLAGVQEKLPLTRLAMYVDDVWRTDRVTTDRILKEASSWGMDRRTASDIVRDLLGKVPGATREALAEAPGCRTISSGSSPRSSVGSQEPHEADGSDDAPATGSRCEKGSRQGGAWARE